MHVISVELQSLPFDVMSRFLVPTSMDSCLFVSIYVFFLFLLLDLHFLYETGISWRHISPSALAVLAQTARSDQKKAKWRIGVDLALFR